MHRDIRQWLCTAIGEGCADGRRRSQAVGLGRGRQAEERALARRVTDGRPLDRLVVAATGGIEAAGVQHLAGVAVGCGLTVDRDINRGHEAVRRADQRVVAASRSHVGCVHLDRPRATDAGSSRQFGHDQVGARRQGGTRPPTVGAGVEMNVDGVDGHRRAAVVDDPHGAGIVAAGRGRTSIEGGLRRSVPRSRKGGGSGTEIVRIADEDLDPRLCRRRHRARDGGHEAQDPEPGDQCEPRQPVAATCQLFHDPSSPPPCPPPEGEGKNSGNVPCNATRTEEGTCLPANTGRARRVWTP